MTKALEAEWYDRLFSRKSYTAGMNKEHASFIARHATGSVLDLGCGMGLLANKLHNMEYLGLDFSNYSIAYSTMHCRNPKAAFMEMDLRNPLEIKMYDTVVLSEVLEHVEDPEGVVSYARRLCKKVLIVTLPVHMPMNCHVKGTWSREDIFSLFGRKPLVLEQGCPHRGKMRHWHFAYGMP